MGNEPTLDTNRTANKLKKSTGFSPTMTNFSKFFDFIKKIKTKLIAHRYNFSQLIFLNLTTKMFQFVKLILKKNPSIINKYIYQNNIYR